MNRKPRTYMHKGKLRTKRRLPRKLKKVLNKKWEVDYDKYINKLKKYYGDDWIDHVIIGG